MRLITRSDFDGLACAALLEEHGVIDDYLFVHPKDMQDGKVQVGSNDVLANVPFVPGCGMWFDHHSSEEERLAKNERFAFTGASYRAPSCARVIYDHFGGAPAFWKFDENGLMEAVDKSDSGSLSEEEIKHPKGWVLLSFIMDPRTGLGRFKDYRISNHALMKDMIGYCRNLKIDGILALPDVKERQDRYFEQEKAYEAMLRANSRIEGNVLFIDLRGVAEIQSGNRFLEYALWPRQNVSLRILWGREKQNVVITAGHSVLDRSCLTDIGSLMLRYGGGGHRQVGTCQVETGKAEPVIAEVLAELKKG
jgi:nanoRNase/pAp phosphatase (c-di-AMP/oligoRNAs hydrolase)